jgi:hypothetical protein
VPFRTPPEVLDRLTFGLDAGVVLNRLLVLAAGAACLTVVHRRFGRERAAESRAGGLSVLDLSTPHERLRRGDAAASHAREGVVGHFQY